MNRLSAHFVGALCLCAAFGFVFAPSCSGQVLNNAISSGLSSFRGNATRGSNTLGSFVSNAASIDGRRSLARGRGSALDGQRPNLLAGGNVANSPRLNNKLQVNLGKPLSPRQTGGNSNRIGNVNRSWRSPLGSAANRSQFPRLGSGAAGAFRVNPIKSFSSVTNRTSTLPGLQSQGPKLRSAFSGSTMHNEVGAFGRSSAMNRQDSLGSGTSVLNRSFLANTGGGLSSSFSRSGLASGNSILGR